MFDRSAWSVPAGCPEPYLYGRLFSGSEIAVGVEAASAKEEVGESAYFIKCMVAQSVEDLRAKQLHQLGLVAASRISANLSSLILARCAPRFVLGEGSNKAAVQGYDRRQEAEAATSVGAARKQIERPSIVHTSMYLPEPVYEALRKIAFEELLKIHDVVLEGIDLALRWRGYPLRGKRVLASGRHQLGGGAAKRLFLPSCFLPSSFLPSFLPLPSFFLPSFLPSFFLPSFLLPSFLLPFFGYPAPKAPLRVLVRPLNYP